MRDLHVFLMWCNQAAWRGGGAVAREAALGIGSKPAGYPPTIYRDACIECDVAVCDYWLVMVLWISLNQHAREDSHADFRIIAKGIYQDSGRCRRRDLWPCSRC